jgi:hypothetical protein
MAKSFRYNSEAQPRNYRAMISPDIPGATTSRSPIFADSSFPEFPISGVLLGY